MEAYAIIAQYPVEFPKIKNASMKWAWKQDTQRGWCVLPANISHRLNKDSKHSLCDVIMQAELAMTALSKVASAVVEKKPKERMKWTAELETKLVSCIFSCPRLDNAAMHTKLQKTLAGKFAVVIATKLLELLKLGVSEVRRQGMTRGELPFLGRETTLMVAVQQHLDNPAFPVEDDKQNVSVVTGPLEPKAIQMDAHGRPMSQHELVQLARTAVEDIPWGTWAELVTKPKHNEMAKMFLYLAMTTVHGHVLSSLPIALVRKGNIIRALATRDLKVGELVVPLFFNRQNSMVMDDEGGPRHAKGSMRTCLLDGTAIRIYERGWQ